MTRELLEHIDELTVIEGYDEQEKSLITEYMQSGNTLSVAEIFAANDLYGNDSLQLIYDEGYKFVLKTKFKEIVLQPNFGELSFKGNKDIQKVMNYLDKVVNTINQYDTLTLSDWNYGVRKIEQLSELINSAADAEIEDAIVYLFHIEYQLEEDLITEEEVLGINDIPIVEVN